MLREQPILNRKSSVPWDRLRPVKQDPLEAVGFVSKGDTRLLDPKTQESYYHKITARYMQFCAQHSKDLQEVFASLNLKDNASVSMNAVKNSNSKTASLVPVEVSTSSVAPRVINNIKSLHDVDHAAPKAADELSTILMSLRKLREGLLATSRMAPSPTFSQRVHVFNIRLAILAYHPPSYHPSLRHLLFVLHSRVHPLSASELREVLTYLILDTAMRRADLHEAYALRSQAQRSCNYHSCDVDQILKAVIHNNWTLFWRVWVRVDGYVRALMFWYVASMRKISLKAIGRSYHKSSIQYVLQSACGGEMTWDELVEHEDIGWIKDGDSVVIRKPKQRA